MNSRSNNLLANIDWVSILLYLLLVLIGWLNIYAAVYDENHSSILDISQKYGKQLIWIGAAFVLAFLVLLTDSKFFTTFSMVIYGIMIFLLIAVLFFGTETKGARSWFEVGDFRIQPAEFAKFATNLAIAYIMSRHNFKVMRFSSLLTIGLILALPAGLIILQNDTGSALVYSSFILVLFREGLHGSILLLCFVAAAIFIMALLYSPFTVLLVIIGGTLIAFYYYRHDIRELFQIILFIGCGFGLFVLIKWMFNLSISDYYMLLIVYVITSITAIYPIYKRKMKNMITLLLISWLCVGAAPSVNYAFNHLQPHQQDRINELLGIKVDPKGTGYNVTQSKIAIGSGGLLGKGFLQGTQTKLNFVPEQSTDFIFCTVGEEWGFVGSTFVIVLLAVFILRIIKLAERQRSSFSRIYGYGVASILFFHVAVNIGMTIGMAPVIGIPLPFFSYGGSSLWSFTILIFIFLRLDANRLQVFR
ncbi:MULTISPECIES: rod shape-determining protein RodA [Butyricimonas]|jgi:rod shape-determining protein rodA|uniref:Cell wall polymerase n=1 Tax=Butyricimonas faecihominis TaxID=1472416 RepID=A0A7W6HT52_9BACT|nr:MULTISPECIES: rod shape-determining protein RodA [Butyricimonas]MBS6686793.1 rod shape-determining protein RodA [Sanguibacteroides justesenii]OKZ15153.1 MAG: rod shape-determining protein RodA [Butyricimonas synergistica]KAB1507626.1 rod shape-determining protein RodA [Butyricimonas faecihominis]MBB4024492.1 rod shape determining protein RodA [Butyricimonas faecihominis]WOF08081.1 rod shape-determining protein RodA [Butyricimonas faecihominis]